MRKSRFSDQQIALALQHVEHGASVAEVCRKLGIAEQTYYLWKKRFAEMAPSEIKKMKQLEEENRRLKGLVADLTLDKQMLHEVLRKKDLALPSVDGGARHSPSRPISTGELSLRELSDSNNPLVPPIRPGFLCRLTN